MPPNSSQLLKMLTQVITPVTIMLVTTMITERVKRKLRNRKRMMTMTKRSTTQGWKARTLSWS
jgi:hypothetical protein